jgi:hypothetical protein
MIILKITSFFKGHKNNTREREWYLKSPSTLMHAPKGNEFKTHAALLYFTFWKTNASHLLEFQIIYFVQVQGLN